MGTTPTPTSRRKKLKMLPEMLLDLSALLFLMAVFRPPPTLLTLSMDLLLKFPMRYPCLPPRASRGIWLQASPSPGCPRLQGCCPRLQSCSSYCCLSLRGCPCCCCSCSCFCKQLD